MPVKRGSDPCDPTWPATATGLTLAAVLLVGCGSGEPDGRQGFEVRDSAGVSIVDNFSPDDPPGAWTVTEPTVHCSSVPPGGDIRLHQVGALVPLTGDSVAVAVRSTEQILICADGAVHAAFGGEGDGPGEYRGITGLFAAGGDSLAVVESRRLTLLDRASGDVRTTSLAELPGGSGGRLRAADGVITVITSIPSPDGPSGPRMAAMTLMDPRGTALHRLEAVPWDAAMGMHTVVLFLWAAGSPWTMDASGYWLASQDTAEFRLLDESGVVFSARSPGAPYEMTEELWDRGADHFRENVEFQPPLPDEMIDDMVDPEGPVSDYAAPAVVRIVVDTEGRPWIRLPEARPLEERQRWRVFSREGRWLTDVELPPRMYVRVITADRVYGVATDALGLESVVSVGVGPG